MLQLIIEEMTCQHCASSIRKALTALDKCALVDIDLTNHTVTVASAKTKHDILTTIHNVGYRINTINGEPVTDGL